LKRILLIAFALVSCTTLYAETSFVDIYRFVIDLPEAGKAGKARIGANKVKTKHGTTLSKLKITTRTDLNDDGDFTDHGEESVRFNAPSGGTEAIVGDIEWDPQGHASEVQVEISVNQNGTEAEVVNETWRSR